MAQVTFSVQMDEELKRQFDALCADFGMTASTAINVFAQTVVRERRIPFEIESPDQEITRKKAMQAFANLRRSAQRNDLSDMTLTRSMGRSTVRGMGKTYPNEGLFGEPISNHFHALRDELKRIDVLTRPICR